MDLSKLTKSDKIIVVAGLVLFIASFLPWFTVSAGSGAIKVSASGSGWDVGFLWAGLPALLGLAAAAALLASKAGTAKLPDLPVSWAQAFFGAGVLSAVLVLLKFVIGEDSAFGLDVDRSWGLFLAVLAALAFAAGGFLKFNEEKAGNPA